ncbi:MULTISPECIES: hypothetical protein [Psychrilyobacter]|nr:MULTISPECIES: hypothetical protein [Psychrilyobacter]
MNKLQPQIKITDADMDSSDFPDIDKKAMMKLREELLPYYKKLRR